MALNYNTIDMKPEIKATVDGQETKIIDLLAICWEEEAEENTGDIAITTEDYIARPDLVSIAKLGTDMYADYICKANGISNPFDLNKDTVLAMPTSTSIEESIRTRETDCCELVEDEDDFIADTTNINEVSRQSARSSGTRARGDDPLYIIDKSSGMVLY